MTDEAAGRSGVLGMAVDGNVNGGTDSIQVLQLLVADDIEGVSTDVLHQL